MLNVLLSNDKDNQNIVKINGARNNKNIQISRNYVLFIAEKGNWIKFRARIRCRFGLNNMNQEDLLEIVEKEKNNSQQ